MTTIEHVETTGQLAAIVEYSGDAIFSKTLDGVILTWNAAAERLYGYSAQEIVGESVSLLVPADRGGELESILARLSQGETIDHFESMRVRKDASLVEVSITISPVRDASGHIAAASDHHSRHLRAQADRSAGTSPRPGPGGLESQVGVPGHHEPRDPHTTERRHRPHGAVARHGADRDAAPLCQGGPELGRGAARHRQRHLGLLQDRGGQAPARDDFDLVEAIEEVAGLVAESARAKGLELVAFCSPEVPSALRGDVGRLRQILLNFATNAVMFTRAGEVVLRADLAEAPTADQVVVRIEMADTGIGVDPDTAERLFEPFSQADASTTRRFGGTGLGLSICRRLADDPPPTDRTLIQLL